MRFRLFAMLFATAALALASIAHAGTPFPGTIELLPGYQHKALQGIDSRVGEITSKAGVKIQYDIGRLAGNYAAAQKDCKWQRTQKVHGLKVELAYTNNEKLFVTFPQSSANFYADIRSPEELADVLLITLSYIPRKGS